MDIVVCVKHVPETAEVEIAVDKSGKSIVTEDLVFDINEWDDYALEEAVLLKEKLGGSIAKILHRAIKDLPFDLILTGAQAGDDGYAQVGVVLAELLGIPHATMVKKVEPVEGLVKINRELEGGLEETVEVELPTLLTIQTGINEPRYVSIMGIRKARAKEINVLGLEDLQLGENEVGESGSWMTVERMFIPPAEKEAEILGGSPDEVTLKIVEILRARGLI